MANNEKKIEDQLKQKNNKYNNACPKKDKDGNCLVPGFYSDSDPIGGGG